MEEFDEELDEELDEETEEELDEEAEEALEETAEEEPEEAAEELQEDRDGLDDATLRALSKPVEDRTAREAELVDCARFREYEAQKIFRGDPETGRLLRDETGGLVEAAARERGSQVPDGCRLDEEGYHLREVKKYDKSSIYALGRNIREQTEKRREGDFRVGGREPEITYVVTPGQHTLADFDYLYEQCRDLGVDLELQMK